MYCKSTALRTGMRVIAKYTLFHIHLVEWYKVQTVCTADKGLWYVLPGYSVLGREAYDIPVLYCTLSNKPLL